VTRGGKAFIVDPDFTLGAGDVLTVAATFNGIEETRKRLGSAQKEA
jgi:Trk K+ transport system NAD-binding subunit